MLAFNVDAVHNKNILKAKDCMRSNHARFFCGINGIGVGFLLVFQKQMRG
jgi:hypothetical protein